jgi:hypothetical protein
MVFFFTKLEESSFIIIGQKPEPKLRSDKRFTDYI